MDLTFNDSWILGVVLAAWLYFTRFNELSETELVRWSYIWLPLVIFGLAGFIAMKDDRLSLVFESGHCLSYRR